MKKSPKGFAVIEILLLLIIVSVLGAVGWYALHTKHQTDQILAQADKIAQSAPSPTNSSQQTFLIISEWGVKLKTNPTVKNLTYVMASVNKDNPGPYAFLSTKELDASVVCQKYYAPIAGYNFPSYQYIKRYAPGDKAPLNETTLEPVEQVAVKRAASFKKVGVYYYEYNKGNGMPCSEQRNEDFYKAFLTIRAAN